MKDETAAVTRRSLSAIITGWLDEDQRRAIFNEIADGAADASTLYWLVLILAGAIALLGLALNSAAVVIGAMLIAPLLTPVLGLALGLAVGDGRLAVQTAITVVISTLAVVGIAAIATVLLPFHEVTAEILGRTRPTTLDLAIAVCSGLAGALVKLSRGNRLAGAVPGVAVSVALVPPLAVAGFGIGIGWNWPVIRGSLLLYGANLAGIVMSAMIVLLVAGMHRAEVLDELHRWHEQSERTGIAAWIDRTPGLRSMGVLESVPARLLLVLAFVALVAIPLSASLEQITREARVHRAVDAAVTPFSAPGRSFIVSRDVTLGNARTQVILNVATTRWFEDSARRTFERRASAIAGEPVDLVLEQLPASSRDLGHLAAMIESRHPSHSVTSVNSDTLQAASPSASVGALQSEVGKAIGVLTLPDSILSVGFVLSMTGDSAAPHILLRYLARDTLTMQATEIIRRQLANALQLPSLSLGLERFSPESRAVSAGSMSMLDTLSMLARANPSLGLVLVAGSGVPQSRIDSALARLAAAGTAENRIAVRRTEGGRLAARIEVH